MSLFRSISRAIRPIAQLVKAAAPIALPLALGPMGIGSVLGGGVLSSLSPMLQSFGQTRGGGSTEYMPDPAVALAMRYQNPIQTSPLINNPPEPDYYEAEEYSDEVSDEYGYYEEEE